MAQTPEAKVKAFVKKTMFAHFPDIWYYSAPGGPFGNVGVPDHLYLWGGVFIAIECKANGNKPTALQMKHLQHIEKCGGVAAVVTDIDNVKMLRIVEAIKSKVQNGTK